VPPPRTARVWVATYDQDAAHYVRTVIVGSGTPALNGRFNDKTAIEVDRGVSSRYRGNVYAAWSVFQGVGGNNSISFVRSTDHGATFSQPQKISTGSKNVQFADIAVTSNGTVYVAYRQFESNRGHQESSIQYVVSTDGGRSFSKPATATTFEPFDAADSAGDPAAAATAHDQAYENADGPASEAGEESVGDSRDCGSGPSPARAGSSSSVTTASRGSPPTPRPPTRRSTSSTTRPFPAPSRLRRPPTTPPTRPARRCASVRAASTTPA